MTAAVFALGRGLDGPTTGLLVGAVIGVVGFVAVLVTRARDAADTEAVDTAVNVGLAEMQPEVEAVSSRLRSEVAAALGAGRARRIVELRTVTLDTLAAEGIVLEPVDPEAPAGAVIIEALLATWIPEAWQGEIRPGAAGGKRPRR